MTRYFITGIDTDCGKTYVTCLLLDFFRMLKKNALAIKPVATGAYYRDECLQSSDVYALQEHNQFKIPINKWCYQPPISPHLAARAAGQKICAAEIAAFCDDSSFAKAEPLLIEGAGGILVPLNDDETWLDFLKLSQTPVIVVVGMRLGCINHALLSDMVLKSAGVPYAGWIANCLDPNMRMLEENIETLIKKMHKPLLARVPYQGRLMPCSTLIS